MVRTAVRTFAPPRVKATTNCTTKIHTVHIEDLHGQNKLNGESCVVPEADPGPFR